MTTQPDWFHGVDGGGNCLPGPQVPRGLVRVGPDMVNHNTSGYASGEDLRHFSHLHVAGTGGQGRYGNIGVVPMAQRPDARINGLVIENETARSGYYAVNIRQRNLFGELGNSGSIRCELTATRCCAVHRWTFGEGMDPWVRIDIGACIGGCSTGGWSRWIGDHVLTGCGHYRGGWGHDLPYSVFFRMEFDQPVTTRSAHSEFHPSRPGPDGEGPGLMVSACLGSARRVVARVGISFVSIAQAQRHLEKEVSGRDFDTVAAETAGKWDQLLGRFRVEGGSAQDRQLWTTLWQRLHAMPGDLRTDEVPWMAAQQRQFNDLYCLWDSVRCANSLLALVDPPFAADLCASLVEIGEQTGWIPDAWITGGAGYIQGGCSAAVLLAEAAAKRLPGLEPARSLAALRRTLETPGTDPLRQGRWPGWDSNGFLPVGVRNCASRTVEYAFHDHCTARLAELAGDRETAARYDAQAARLWESWHPEHRCFAPRHADGSWDAFDPWRPQRRDFWSDPHFYEGTGHDYAMTSWHVMEELVVRHGGAQKFAAHLELYLDRCYMWKEINLHAPWLFHYAGMPGRVAPALHALMDRKLTTGRRGLSDNEDMGAWSSWWITGAMGLCPIPGCDRYLLAAPRFDRIELDLAGAAKPLTLSARGERGAVLRAVSLNGQPLDRFWVTHAEIGAGAEIGFHF